MNLWSCTADYIVWYGNSGTSIPSYLSHATLGELFPQIRNHVGKKIRDEMQKERVFQSLLILLSISVTLLNWLWFVMLFVMTNPSNALFFFNQIITNRNIISRKNKIYLFIICEEYKLDFDEFVLFSVWNKKYTTLLSFYTKMVPTIVQSSIKI